MCGLYLSSEGGQIMAELIRFSELTPVSCESKWFRVYDLGHRIKAVFEPFHFQEVISYLIEGDETALLFDSGMGIGDIRAVVASMTDKPVVLLNSHSHFDHVGGNWQFDTAYILDAEGSAAILETGYSLPQGDANLSTEAVSYPGELWFDPCGLCVRPCHVTPVRDGHIFELGGRRLRVIAAPGHSRDSIVLADDESRLLFTGDTVYPAPLYAYLEGDEQVKVYAETLRALSAHYSSYTLYCSHNNPIWDGQALKEVSDAFDSVLSGYISGNEQDGHTVYDFGDFSIVI